MKGFGLYLLILVCLLAGVSYVVSQTQKTESISYSDVYSYFEQGDVDRYTLEGGTLTMHLKNENRAGSATRSATIPRYGGRSSARSSTSR